ncbi:MAG: tubulin-like doman-containing protein [Deltaproteobacteria bacterium]|nr:tubulin-like doman-containing protein [Deltaproteobacteria bacterium]
MSQGSYKAHGLVDELDAADFLRKFEEEPKKLKHGRYPPTILIGLGGTGSKAILWLRRMMLERFGKVDALPGVAYLSIDTDTASDKPPAEEMFKHDPYSEQVSFKPHERLNTKVNFTGILGPNLIQHPHIREWWDPSLEISESFNLETGAGQMRPLSRLVFFGNHERIQDALKRAQAQVTSVDLDNTRLKVDDKVRVVVVAGWAGGTGSGMFLDLAALIRTCMGQKIRVDGFFVLPGVFASVEKQDAFPKIAANGYAALREMNHYLSHPFKVRWGRHAPEQEVAGLYDRYVLYSGTNVDARTIASPGDCYRAIAESLFLDFAGGAMASFIDAVRINREQYLKSFVSYSYTVTAPDGTPKETHAEKWNTAFGAFGVSKLVYPSWRLLNYAKYDLAGEMVGLMDPGRVRITDVVTRDRERFMIEAGIFQGETTDEHGVRAPMWQIRDALAKQSGTASASSTIYAHIEDLQREFVEMAENLYTEKSTAEEGRHRWLKLQNLFGDPASPGNEGDWARHILKNRKDLERTVAARLPDVVEQFRRLPSMGPSGVATLIAEVLEQLKRPHDQAKYAAYLRTQIIEQGKIADETKLDWNKRIKNADDASRGFGRSADTHRAAVERAGESLREHWRAKVTQYICEEGIKVLESITRSLEDNLSRVRKVCDGMFELQSKYLAYRDFFKVGPKSEQFIELPLGADYGELLRPYLGLNAAAREEKLQRLLNRGLLEMKLDTLEKIAAAVTGDAFREDLAARAFYALRGHDGRTSAFAADGEPDEPGFIERHSLVHVLAKMSDEERSKILERVYAGGLPWVSHNDDPTDGLTNPKQNAFIGFVDQDDVVTGKKIMEVFKKKSFNPIRVATNDPSELIFYTELNAFAGYYVGEVHGNAGLRQHYEKLVSDDARQTPLHLHQDYHQFQEIVPLRPLEVQRLQSAWRLFLKAQILGIVRSIRFRRQDDTRFAYQWRRNTGGLDTTWIDLGPEAAVVKRLRGDPQMPGDLAKDIEQHIQKFLSAGGSWAHLVALADYFRFCIFPTRTAVEISAATAQAPIGSIENLVVNELRAEWHAAALKSAPLQGAQSDNELNSQIEKLIASMDKWAVPVARTVGDPVPSTADLPLDRRVDDWQLLQRTRDGSARFVGANEMKQSRDAAGGVETRFPRLAVRWDFFVPPDDRGDAAAGGTVTVYWYKGDSGTHTDVTLARVVELVKQKPGGRHRVFARGWKEWREATDVPDISEILRPTTTPPATTTTPPMNESGVPAGASFHYARNGEKQGTRTPAEIAESIAKDPRGKHKVWHKTFGSAWRDAHTVPEISALLPEEPPPLDDDEPPPLND